VKIIEISRFNASESGYVQRVLTGNPLRGEKNGFVIISLLNREVSQEMGRVNAWRKIREFLTGV